MVTVRDPLILKLVKDLSNSRVERKQWRGLNECECESGTSVLPIESPLLPFIELLG